MDWVSLAVSLALCALVGAGVHVTFGLSWLGVSAALQGVAWVGGLWASEDEAWPGDDGYEHAKGSAAYRSHLGAIRLHQAMISLAFGVSAVGFLCSGGRA